MKFNYQTSVQLLPGRPINFSPFSAMWRLFIKPQLRIFQRQRMSSLLGKYNEQEMDLYSSFAMGGAPRGKKQPTPCGQSLTSKSLPGRFPGSAKGVEILA